MAKVKSFTETAREFYGDHFEEFVAMGPPRQHAHEALIGRTQCAPVEPHVDYKPFADNTSHDWLCDAVTDSAVASHGAGQEDAERAIAEWIQDMIQPWRRQAESAKQDNDQQGGLRADVVAGVLDAIVGRLRSKAWRQERPAPTDNRTKER